ncbi:Prephenate dehydrogenase OS=Tsukamurella paurometabola (strain ATCC 8368 / DSM / CCUG 35730/ CIP 100753 / JCM 10117 / KCTC 9821 / NBRC 16120 / NCIMB 702349/ NCTC 13040) OX=521096 GN=Tpau_4050 PE=4 SV=1 [Tsukamurella paurometabola]|uniref:Prephenate dehydrogenase n=1 Tax=Tsukamurella paurometabola (strain ATCC 8368 / DSM 20162 / CCUG 35730 / CIP 100753 / JCM 10117 / KCTC 9821 / NBRC 16120 / NCIMB 702349 / NCTC 13040) TaxID=521096 RepID=D5UNC6_TSUPD|nr:Prephenate dehydrogenase [Tsukamurella paurometabola DSM 20162]SUP40318.1 Arogenate dehydrogenase [Tsukamurella paurometabola]
MQRAPHSDLPVCVLGLGLIGGSILRALHRAGRTAYGWNRSAAAADDASAAGFDASSDLEATLRRADAGQHVIVLAVPVPALDPVLAAIAENAPNAWLTDAVSVKGDVARRVADAGLTARYAGGHPMAGTAFSGWDATDATLFDGATWVVTADDATPAPAWRLAASVGLDCGAVVVPAGSAEHDAAVARISHSVHVVAEAVAITAESDPAAKQLALTLAASSFRDVTRVAGTAPSLVNAMCEANRDALLDALDDTIAELIAARTELADSGTVRDVTERGYAARRAYDNARRTPVVPVLDGAGWQRALREAGHAGGVVTELPTT